MKVTAATKSKIQIAMDWKGWNDSQLAKRIGAEALTALRKQLPKRKK